MVLKFQLLELLVQIEPAKDNVVKQNSQMEHPEIDLLAREEQLIIQSDNYSQFC
jgi:hypothetical protein